MSMLIQVLPPHRHSREGGNPCWLVARNILAGEYAVDGSRLCGND